MRSRPNRRWNLERLESRRLLACLDDPSTDADAPVAAVFSPPPSGSALVSATLADDRFESNDRFSSAASLGSVGVSTTVADLVMADGVDWYRFTLPARPASGARLSIAFDHDLGDLDLALYSGSGRRLRSSDGVTDVESISLGGLAAGTYYVAAYGYRGATNPDYSLTILTGSTGAAPLAPPTTTSTTTSSNSNASNTSTTTGSNSTSGANGGYDIQFVFSGMTAAQQAIFEQAAGKWESIIVGDLPDATYGGRLVDDLLVHVSVVSIDGRGGALAQAGADRFRAGSQLPYHGVMQFDSADLAAMQADGSLRSVAVHELGHVLGFGTLWESKGLLSGADGPSPQFTGAQAVAEYNALFGTSSRGVPVESSGGPGTRDAHWSEAVFGSELMTGYVGPNATMPLSRITVASLADLGYRVNFAAADPYSPPGWNARSTFSGGSTGVAGSSSTAVGNSTSTGRSTTLGGSSSGAPRSGASASSSSTSSATTVAGGEGTNGTWLADWWNSILRRQGRSGGWWRA